MKLTKIDLNFIIVGIIALIILSVSVSIDNKEFQVGLLDVLKLTVGGMIGYLSRD